MKTMQIAQAAVEKSVCIGLILRELSQRHH